MHLYSKMISSQMSFFGFKVRYIQIDLTESDVILKVLVL
jgi:hypothetical protein